LFVASLTVDRREKASCLNLIALGSDATLLDLDPLTHVVSPSRELNTCKPTLPYSHSTGTDGSMPQKKLHLTRSVHLARERRPISGRKITPQSCPLSTSVMTRSRAGRFCDGGNFDDTHAHVRTGSWSGSWVYQALFPALQGCSLLGSSHTHRCIFGASRFTVGVSLIMVYLDVNEVNPGPDREAGHTRRAEWVVRFWMRL